MDYIGLFAQKLIIYIIKFMVRDRMQTELIFDLLLSTTSFINLKHNERKILSSVKGKYSSVPLPPLTNPRIFKKAFKV